MESEILEKSNNDSYFLLLPSNEHIYCNPALEIMLLAVSVLIHVDLFEFSWNAGRFKGDPRRAAAAMQIKKLTCSGN